MHDLERMLRGALKRKEAPASLTDDVMARVARESPAHSTLWSRLGMVFSAPQMRWAAAGVLALALTAGGIIQHRRAEIERRKGEVAKAQLIQALRIASAKLNGTWRKALEPDRRTPQS